VRVPDETERIAIERVRPDVDCGRFASKRIVGDVVDVEADIFTHGHDEIAANVEFRHASTHSWRSVAMVPLGNDRWRGSFRVDKIGEYRFRVVAWVDEFESWRRDILAKSTAAQDVTLDREVGALLAEESAKRAGARDRDALVKWAGRLRDDLDARTLAALSQLVAIGRRTADRSRASVAAATSPVWVDRPLAGCSAWYELFPRSASADPGRSGTLADVIDRLPYVAELGFDILYLPPIHPIGITHRKGANNATVARADDVGSPWAIGAAAGGHTAVHPDLGTVEDVEALVRAARERGIEIALDFALQTSPDHPWVTEHPEWFRHRPDGSIAYAENPPKRYEDIYPIDFDTEDRRGLWLAILDVLTFWIDRGIEIFRVDNPHTKPLAFWEWLIAAVRRANPRVLFLSEAFTRPRMMERLAKVGFTQSYTYFTWRNSKYEIVEYFRELNEPDHRDYFRPNVWPNTPDILHASLQQGDRATFLARFVLAAGLSANYGIYGPAFELQEHVAREPGSEEYRDSEKYQVRHWDLERTDSLRHFIARVNAIRRAHPALQRDGGLHFHDVDNDALLCWSKRAGDDVVLVAVSIDPHHVQSGWVTLAAEPLGVDDGEHFTVVDLLTGARYPWHQGANFVRLDPAAVPAHIFSVERELIA
jgi:starch synthase (maltosyl-transferring)